MLLRKIRFLGQTLLRLTLSAGKQKWAYHGEREVKLGWVGWGCTGWGWVRISRPLWPLWSAWRDWVGAAGGGGLPLLPSSDLSPAAAVLPPPPQPPVSCSPSNQPSRLTQAVPLSPAFPHVPIQRIGHGAGSYNGECNVSVIASKSSLVITSTNWLAKGRLSGKSLQNY